MSGTSPNSGTLSDVKTLAEYLDDALYAALDYDFGLEYSNGPELAIFLAEYLLERRVTLPYLYDYLQARLAGMP